MRGASGTSVSQGSVAAAAPAWSMAAPGLVRALGAGALPCSAVVALARATGSAGTCDFVDHGGSAWQAAESKSSSSSSSRRADHDHDQQATGGENEREDEDEEKDPGRYAERARLAEPMIARRNSSVDAVAASADGSIAGLRAATQGTQRQEDISGHVPGAAELAALAMYRIAVPCLRLLRSILCCYAALGTGGLFHEPAVAAVAAAAAREAERQAEHLLGLAAEASVDPVPEGEEDSPNAAGRPEDEPDSDSDSESKPNKRLGPSSRGGEADAAVHPDGLAASLSPAPAPAPAVPVPALGAATAAAVRAMFRPSPVRGNLGRWFDPRAALVRTPGQRPRKTALPAACDAVVGLKVHAARLGRLAAMPLMLLVPPSAVLAQEEAGADSESKSEANEALNGRGGTEGEGESEGAFDASTATVRFDLLSPLRMPGCQTPLRATWTWSSTSTSTSTSIRHAVPHIDESSAASEDAGQAAAAAADPSGNDERRERGSAAAVPHVFEIDEAIWPPLLPLPAVADFRKHGAAPARDVAEQLPAAAAAGPPALDEQPWEGRPGRSVLVPYRTRLHAAHPGEPTTVD